MNAKQRLWHEKLDRALAPPPGSDQNPRTWRLTPETMRWAHETLTLRARTEQRDRNPYAGLTDAEREEKLNDLYDELAASVGLGPRPR
jgi:hypothetical protein